MTSATPFKEALDELTRIKKRSDESVKKLNQYKGFEETLEKQITVVKEIDDFNNKYDFRFKLWKDREQFDEF